MHYDLNKEFDDLQLEQGVQTHYDLNKEFVLQSQPVYRPWPYTPGSLSSTKR